MDDLYGYTGDISSYGPLGLPPAFWGGCWKGNKTNILVPFITIGTYKFIISLRTMKSIVLVCKWFFGIVQKKILECRYLFFKWGPILAKKIVPYLVNRSHPIKYTSTCIKVIPIDGDMGANDKYGISILDTRIPLFSEDELISTRYALKNIGFFVRTPISFVMILFVYNIPLAIHKIFPSDCIDRGSLTPAIESHYYKKYGSDRSSWPGRYYVNMDLPIKFNPITLGLPIIHIDMIHCCIVSHCIDMGDGSGASKVAFDVSFVLENFTHAIAQFRTVSNTEYDWSRYSLTYNDQVDNPLYVTSLLQRI